MTSEHERTHLSPEVFIDMVEGAPVEASWHQHLSTCAPCRAELASLEATLSLVHEDAGHEMPVERARAKRRVPTWLLTAAAVALAALGLYRFVGERDTSSFVVAEIEELLPPADDDDAFQLLLALSDSAPEALVDLVEFAEMTTPAFDGFALDPAPMTPEERQLFVERLTEEMRSSL